jgi:hypothetical protein
VAFVPDSKDKSVIHHHFVNNEAALLSLAVLPPQHQQHQHSVALATFATFSNIP